MPEVFKTAEQLMAPGLQIAALLRRSRVKGSVGLEVEVEGNAFPKPQGYGGSKPVPMGSTMGGFWSCVKDGSLRGQDNAEYILTKPIDFSEVPKAVDALSDALKAYGSVLADSNRTSVHVHLNCQSFHMNRVASFCALYFCFEEILTEWCGDHRVGNLFCLRGKDAPGIVTKIKRFIQSDGQTELTEGLHYSGLNAHALTKFGSLEVRTLRGPTNLSIIKDWVALLQRIYEKSADFVDPRDIPALFSQQGPDTFFDSILGEHAYSLRQGVSFSNEQVRSSMYEGIRMAQDLCYCRDWTYFQPVDAKEDPFGRDPALSTPITTDGVNPSPSSFQMFQALYNPTTGLESPTPTSASLFAAQWLTETSSETEPEPEDEDEDDEDYDYPPEWDDDLPDGN